MFEEASFRKFHTIYKDVKEPGSYASELSLSVHVLNHSVVITSKRSKAVMNK